MDHWPGGWTPSEYGLQLEFHYFDTEGNTVPADNRYTMTDETYMTSRLDTNSE